MRIPIGTLDNDPGIKPSVHIFVASKAPWFEITDSLPQYPEMPEMPDPLELTQDNDL